MGGSGSARLGFLWRTSTKPLLVQVEAADIHGGHLSVSPLGGHLSVPLIFWALQALAIRGGANGLYPLIGTPVVLLVVLGRVGWNGNQALLGTTSVWLLGEPDGSYTVGLLTACRGVFPTDPSPRLPTTGL